jgi:branched-chain amino acid transport system permease protein
VLAKPAQLEMADLKDRFGNFDGESIGHQQWPADILAEELQPTKDVDVPPDSLPYGTRRRVEVARALATGPRVLLLDEPAAGLNEQEQRDLADRIRTFGADGITVLVVEHNLVFLAALAERLICLDRGKVIASGLPEKVRREPAVIEAYLGLEADVPELSLTRPS